MEKTLLNLIPGACSPEVHLSQYDKGRAVPFKLAEGKSAYSVPDGSEIVVQATKPSGLGFVVPVTFDGDTATMTITETMSNEYGRFPAELSITNNGNRIGTANFVMNIERSPHPEGTIDGDAESLLPELTLLVERIEAAADSVDEDTQTVTEAKAEVLQAKADTLQAKADTLSARDESVSAKDLAVSSAETSVEASQRAEELVGSVETKADAIVKTASGEIASFTDGGDDLPMKSLKVNIVPKQSGSGDPSPSNVRPISGYSDVNVNRAGKNLFNPTIYVGGSYNPTVGTQWTLTEAETQLTPNADRSVFTFAIPSSWTNRIFIMPVKYGQNYHCKISIASTGVLGISWGYLDKDFYVLSKTNSINASQSYDNTFTPPMENAVYYYVLFTPRSTSSGTITITTPQNELGSTATAYEPYQGTSYPISLGQTVYGGTLEVMSGKLTITHGRIDLGSLNYGKTTSYARPVFYKDLAGAKIGVENVKPNAYCEIFDIGRSDSAQGLASQGNNLITIAKGTNQLLISYETDMSASDFKTFVTGKYFVYPLATPTEIQLTPTQVKTLLGNNNIFADSGSVEVEYRADTTLAYNELLAMILENIGN